MTKSYYRDPEWLRDKASALRGVPRVHLAEILEECAAAIEEAQQKQTHPAPIYPRVTDTHELWLVDRKSNEPIRRTSFGLEDIKNWFDGCGRIDDKLIQLLKGLHSG
jgi:hypothetical protein